MFKVLSVHEGQGKVVVESEQDNNRTVHEEVPIAEDLSLLNACLQNTPGNPINSDENDQNDQNYQRRREPRVPQPQGPQIVFNPGRRPQSSRVPSEASIVSNAGRRFHRA